MKLNREEENFFNEMIERVAIAINKNFEKWREKFKENGTFQEAINRIATQKNWARKDQHDVYGDMSDIRLWNGFEGTSKESVVGHNFVGFFVGFDGSKNQKIDCLAMKRALTRNNELLLLARAVVSAAKVVEAEKVRDYYRRINHPRKNHPPPMSLSHPQYHQGELMEKMLF